MTELEDKGLPLRERKKAMIRSTIIAEAERLFEERGFDNVTVAEIADAANVSVKTLFVYFRSKEDLAFADTSLLDSIITALENRPAKQTHAEAIAETLIRNLRANSGNGGLKGYQRSYGESVGLKSGLLRLWSQYEDRLTEFLAAEALAPATVAMRLYAVQLIAIPRSLVSPELLATVADLDAYATIAMSERWLRRAAQAVGPFRAGE